MEEGGGGGGGGGGGEGGGHAQSTHKARSAVSRTQEFSLPSELACRVYQ